MIFLLHVFFNCDFMPWSRTRATGLGINLHGQMFFYAGRNVFLSFFPPRIWNITLPLLAPTRPFLAACHFTPHSFSCDAKILVLAWLVCTEFACWAFVLEQHCLWLPNQQYLRTPFALHSPAANIFTTTTGCRHWRQHQTGHPPLELAIGHSKLGCGLGIGDLRASQGRYNLL